MLTYLLAEGRHRRSRTLGSLAGVALGVALFTALIAAGNGFVSAARQPLADIGADIVISRPDLLGEASAQTTRGVRQPFGLAPFADSELDQLREVSGISEVSAGLLLWDFSANSYQTLLGVDPNADAAGPTQLAGSVSKGRFFEQGDTGVVVVDQHYAAFFALMPGESVDIGESSFEVIGIVEAASGKQTAGANFYLPIADARLLAGLDGDQVNQVYVSVDEATNVDQVISEVEGKLGEVSATTEQSIVSVMGGITEVSDRFAAVAASASLLSGLLLTAVTLHAAIRLRTREAGIMKAIGWRASDVVRLFTVEGLVLGALGAVLGIILGWLTILLFSQIPIDLPAISGTTPDLTEVAPADPVSIAAKLSLGAVLVAVAASVATGGLVGFFSARRVSRQKPADALRT